jgi:hypothetical protein
VSVDAASLEQLRQAMAKKAELVALARCNLHLDSEQRQVGLVYAATQGSLVGARIPVSGG